jgi:3-phenylpropionate/cinnamic acid dioxygenase small subunit
MTVDLITQLNDRLEITALIYQTARAMDTRDWTLLETCYMPEAIGDFATGETVGFEQILRQYQGFLTPLDVTQHLIGNVECTLSGDQAVTTCLFQAQHVRSGVEGGEQFVIGGRYDDQVTRTAEGWRLARRRVTGLWTSGNRAVLDGTLRPPQVS